MQEDVGSLLRAMRTQLEEFQSRLLVHLAFEFNESAARAGAGSGKKASRKHKLEQKSALEQLALVHTFAISFISLVLTRAFLCIWLLRLLVCTGMILKF